MKIIWLGYLSQNHSWAIVGQNICRSLKKAGHDVDMVSTNSDRYFPNDLRDNLKLVFENSAVDYKKLDEVLEKNYDMQLSYTILPNFSKYFKRGNTRRYGIWNYETTILPDGFAKNHTYVDYMLPSSNFSKQIFTANGIPENKQIVINHGIDLDKFNIGKKIELKTKKKIKILANIAQPHRRKNLKGLLDVYGKAFTKKDDVCLILKISKNSSNHKDEDKKYVTKLFDIDFKTRYKNHAEVEFIDTFIDDIEDLYNSVDIVFTMSHAECFWMPGLEGFGAKKVVIAPRYGGQLDYMNDNNSILIDGSIMRANNEMQYYNTASPKAKAFNPSIDDAVDKLRYVADHYDDVHSKFELEINKSINNFTWDAIAKQIINIK